MKKMISLPKKPLNVPFPVPSLNFNTLHRFSAPVSNLDSKSDSVLSRRSNCVRNKYRKKKLIKHRRSKRSGVRKLKLKIVPTPRKTIDPSKYMCLHQSLQNILDCLVTIQVEMNSFEHTKALSEVIGVISTLDLLLSGKTSQLCGLASQDVKFLAENATYFQQIGVLNRVDFVSPNVQHWAGYVGGITEISKNETAGFRDILRLDKRFNKEYESRYSTLWQTQFSYGSPRSRKRVLFAVVKSSVIELALKLHQPVSLEMPDPVFRLLLQGIAELKRVDFVGCLKKIVYSYSVAQNKQLASGPKNGKRRLSILTPRSSRPKPKPFKLLFDCTQLISELKRDLVRAGVNKVIVEKFLK